MVANNLASLLSQSSEEPAVLERAERMARRLRQSDQPAFRDTYGWILHRLGRSEEALEHLAFAARGAQSVPLIRLHHGVALAATGETAAARAELEAALALAEAQEEAQEGAQGEVSAEADSDRDAADGDLRARAVAALADLDAAPAGADAGTGTGD